jgi:hypothetical protein
MEIHDIARSHIFSLNHILEVKGYTRWEVKYLYISQNKIIVYFEAVDDFQENLPEEYRVWSGCYERISEPTLQECYEKFQAIPSRHQRELMVLARQTASIGYNLEDLKNEQAKEFAKSIMDSVAELQYLISDMRDA